MFVVHRNHDFIEFHSNIAFHTHVTRLALIRSMDTDGLGFDAAGMLWSFHFERPAAGISMLERFLAHTFYNPDFRVAVTWTQVRPYPLDELRQCYLDALAAGDDVPTQFVGRDELVSRVRACATFQDFVTAWKWQSTAVENSPSPSSS